MSLLSGLRVTVVQIGPCYRAAGFSHAWLFFRSAWTMLVTLKKNAGYNISLAGNIVVPCFLAKIKNIDGIDFEF